MSFAIAPSDVRWEFVVDLCDPPGQRGAPVPNRHRAMVDAMLSIGRTGIQWCHLPGRHPPWNAVVPKGGACGRRGVGGRRGLLGGDRPLTPRP